MGYLVLIIFIILVGIFIVSYRLVEKMLKPLRRTHQEIIDAESENGMLDKKWVEGLTTHEEYITSEINDKLYVKVIENPIKTKKTVIFIHGYGVNLALGYKYAHQFYDMGYNIVLYDHGNSGNSGGKYSTLGPYEVPDLKEVVNYTRKFFGKDTIIGLHGESMGAATACIYAAQDANLSFIIADCGYSDMASECAHQLKCTYHLPRFPFIPVASLIYKFKIGTFMNEMSPIKAVATENASKVPILFIHGADDTFTPPQMMDKLYDAKKGIKEKWLVANAEHAKSFNVDKNVYTRKVKAFIDQYPNK